MRLFFTHTNMIFSMGSDGKDKVNFYNSKTPSEGLCLSMIFFYHFSRQVSIANATAASGLDFHFKRNLLFFTDTDKRKVNPSSFKSV